MADPDPIIPWRVRSSRPLLERKWLTLLEQRVVTSSGAEIDEFHLIQAPDWVAIIARTDDGHIVLVDQYRQGLGGISRELPAGVIDPGEPVLDAARRELLEETGYAADRWQPLTIVSTEPSRHTNRAHFYFADGARAVASPSPEVTEHFIVRLLEPQALLAAIDRGEIVHGLHVAAILLAHRRGWI